MEVVERSPCFYYFKKILLEYSYFTILYSFLLFSKVNQVFCCCSVTKWCPTLCNQWTAARQSSLSPTVSQSWRAIHICTCISLFWISFPFRSLQSTVQSSLCYTVGSHYLPTLYTVSIVYTCQSQSSNSSIPSSPPWYPSICLSSVSVSLLLLCN